MSNPQDPYQQRASYGQPRPPYGRQEPYRQQQPYAQQPQYPSGRPPAPPVLRAPRRLPGLGLVLTLAGMVVQVLSLTVLPWVRFDTTASVSVPKLWQAATDLGTHGFGAWYVVLFSYPLAALGILLALASVLDSVALKVIWAGLTLAGLGVLVLRYGFGPFADLVTTNEGLHFTTQEITTAVIALVALVFVIFILKTALGMFRRIAGLILLGLAGLHVAAVLDLVKGPAELGFGAIGPAIGYVLVAIAAFIGPRRLPGI